MYRWDLLKFVTNFERVCTLNVDDKYKDVMQNKLGTLSGVQHLNVRDDIQPVVMPDRHIPISVRPKLKLNWID